MALLDISPPRVIQAVAIRAPPYLLSAVRMVSSEVAYTDSMRMNLYPPHCTLTNSQQSAKMMFIARHALFPGFQLPPASPSHGPLHPLFQSGPIL